MKTLFKISAVLFFLMFCILSMEIYRNGYRDRPEIFLLLFAIGAVLFANILILKSMADFKPVPGRKYEILEWTKDGNRHCMHIRYLNKNNEYEDGTIKWDGDAEFLGNGNYWAHKYFIKTSMVGLVFLSID